MLSAQTERNNVVIKNRVGPCLKPMQRYGQMDRQAQRTHTHTRIGIVVSWETVNPVITTGQTSCLSFCAENQFLISTSVCLSMSMCDYVSCLWFVI